jgi:hypothetical protein
VPVVPLTKKIVSKQILVKTRNTRASNRLLSQRDTKLDSSGISAGNVAAAHEAASSCKSAASSVFFPWKIVNLW